VRNRFHKPLLSKYNLHRYSKASKSNDGDSDTAKENARLQVQLDLKDSVGLYKVEFSLPFESAWFQTLSLTCDLVSNVAFTSNLYRYNSKLARAVKEVADLEAEVARVGANAGGGRKGAGGGGDSTASEVGLNKLNQLTLKAPGFNP
jgi:hypothetical protein